MKIELHENKIYFKNGSIQKEIHPFWLRERVDSEEFLDKGTQQRLFDPTTLDSEISINTASINEKFLEINFNDGVKSKLDNFMSPHEDEHHNYITQRGGKPIITEENLWIQLIHGDNIWNRLDKMPGQLISAPSDEYLKLHFAYE